MMVGRELAGEAQPVGVEADREVVLEVAGLSTKDLLKDVSFELRKGEILGFAGLMGAGRTEVARAVVGADRIDAGTIRLRGREIRVHNPADAAAPPDRLPVRGPQAVRPAARAGGQREHRAERAGRALPGVGVRQGQGDARDLQASTWTRCASRRPRSPQTAKNLSGGNQQKVVIAKWLVKDCDILIFDEPTRGIDVGAKEEIYRLLNELAQGGKSIIMISSELPEILRMSHRIVVMSEGRVTGTLDAGEATQESVMHYATLRPDENPEDAAELGLASRLDGGDMTVSPPPRAARRRRGRRAPASGTGCSSSSPSRA